VVKNLFAAQPFLIDNLNNPSENAGAVAKPDNHKSLTGSSQWHNDH